MSVRGRRDLSWAPSIGWCRRSSGRQNMPASRRKTRRSYDAALALIGNHLVKDSRRVGSFSLKAITGAVVDKLYVKLLTRDDGTERRRTVNLAMAVARRAWNVARRASADRVPLENPFERMGLKYRPKQTRPVTREELMRLVAAADAAAAPSIGTACMISFYWLLRQSDCLKLAWGSYRPADAPDVARLVHHKTGEPVGVPLFDDDGTTLFPELCDRLDASRRLGSMIVMRDQPDRVPEGSSAVEAGPFPARFRRDPRSGRARGRR